MEVSELVLHNLGGALTGIFFAGVLYWRLIVAEKVIVALQREVSEMPGKHAALRADARGGDEEIWLELRRQQDVDRHAKEESDAWRRQTERTLGGMLTRKELDDALGRMEERLGKTLSALLSNGRSHGQ